MKDTGINVHRLQVCECAFSFILEIFHNNLYAAVGQCDKINIYLQVIYYILL